MELDKGEKVRPQDKSQATIQDPLLALHGSQQSERLSRKPSRRSATPSEPLPPLPIDHEPSDLGEVQPARPLGQIHDYPGEVIGSRTNLQSTFGDGDASRRGVSSGKDSPELSTHGKGKFWPGGRQVDLEASRMFLVFILAYSYLTRSAARFSTQTIRHKMDTTPIVQVETPSVRRFTSSLSGHST